MIVLALADIHGDLSFLKRMWDVFQSSDLVLLTGDNTHFGGEVEIRELVEAVRGHASQVLAVPGNCDHPAVKTWLQEEGMTLHNTCKVLQGIAFVGVGGSLPCPGRTPFEMDEDGFESILARSAQAAEGFPMVLVSHQPPFDTKNDRTAQGRHVGSSAVRRFIERLQPLACFTGHIHEGKGLDTIGRTRIVNPGPFRLGNYAWAEITEETAMVEIRTA